jgi:hypothetical protein
MNARQVVDDVWWILGQAPVVPVTLLALPFALRADLLGRHASPPYRTGLRRLLKTTVAVTCAAPPALLLLGAVWMNHGTPPFSVPEWRFAVLDAAFALHLCAAVIAVVVGRGFRLATSILALVSSSMMLLAWFVAVCTVAGEGP